MAGEWTMANLGDGPLEIIDGDRGSNYPKQQDFASSGHCLFLNAGNVTTSGFNFTDCAFISAEKDSALRKGKLKRHDVVLTTRGTVGNVAYFDDSVPYDHVRINSGMVILRAQPEKLRPRFLYLFLRSLLFRSQVESLRTGSAQPQLPIRDINRIEIPVPPLDDQDAIAHILGTLDDKIELNRRMNETLEAMARALFKSWFVDFDPVRAKAEGRWRKGQSLPSLPADQYDLFPDSFEDSELGEIPRGWEIVRLGEVATVVDYVANGSFASLKKNVELLNKPGYALYVRTTDFNSGFKGGFRFVSRHAYDFLSKSALIGDEVIISNVGDVGTVFRPPEWLGWPMTLGSNAVALKAQAANNYLFRYFRDSVGQAAIASIVTGSAQPKFNKTNLRDLRILIPAPPVLQMFERQIAMLRERESCALTELTTLAALRDMLLPKLISGEVRVKER